MEKVIKLGKKGYLMTAGSLLPATLAIVATSLITKQPLKMNKYTIAAGVAGLIIGGIVTSKMINSDSNFQ